VSDRRYTLNNISSVPSTRR